MKTRFCVVMMLLFAAGLECRGASDHAALIRYVKHLSVARLDPALPSQPLGDWLSSGPPQLTKVEWLGGDCDIKPDGPEPSGGWPLCVRLQLHRREVWGWAIIKVGNVRDGIRGEPQLEYLILTSKTLAQRGQLKRIKKLSGLPRLLAEVEAADRAAQK